MPAEVLWPERESLYDLMVLRATIGATAFESEKQNNPVDPSLCEWPEGYFTWPGFWFEQWPAALDIKTLALDPSKGKDAKHGDYRAFVKLGRDLNRVMYIEADLRRTAMEAIVDEAVEYVSTFGPAGLTIETNQFQELFMADIQRVARDRGVMMTTYGLNNTVNKEVRIRRLGPYLSQRLFRFKAKSPGTALLVQQLRDFPAADHDDGPDALEMSLRLMIELFNKGVRSPKG
jgi:predicted phage terminase large subunit-like protein